MAEMSATRVIMMRKAEKFLAKEKERSDVVFSASSLCLNILFFDHGSNESERCKMHPSDR